MSLIELIRGGHLQELLDGTANYEVDVNEVDVDGNNQLMLVAFVAEEIALSICHLFDLNRINNHGHNVLFNAIMFGQRKLVDHLLQAPELNLTHRDYGGKTILHTVLIRREYALFEPILNAIRSTEELKYILKAKDIRGRSVFDYTLKYLARFNLTVALLETTCIDLDTVLAKIDKSKHPEQIKRICIQRYRERRDFSTYFFPYLPGTVKEIIIVLLTL